MNHLSLEIPTYEKYDPNDASLIIFICAVGTLEFRDEKGIMTMN